MAKSFCRAETQRQLSYTVQESKRRIAFLVAFEVVLFVDRRDVFPVFLLLSGCRNNSFQSEIFSLQQWSQEYGSSSELRP